MKAALKNALVLERSLRPLRRCRAVFKRLDTDLREVVLPVFVGPTYGLDGVSYGLDWECGGNSVHLRWWGGPPWGWKPLTAWHGDAEVALEECLPPVPLEFNIG